MYTLVASASQELRPGYKVVYKRQCANISSLLFPACESTGTAFFELTSRPVCSPISTPTWPPQSRSYYVP